MSNLIAYIDPMSGMLVLQAILAGIIGVAVFFRNTIYGFVSKIFGRKQDSESSVEDESGAA